MINPSEENLLGYLIRANEEHEQEELAKQIRTNAKLRQDCQLLQSGLALPAADEDHLDPPPLLAQRTCSLLWNKVDSGEFPKLSALAKQPSADSITTTATPTDPLAMPTAAPLPMAMAASERITNHDNSLAKPRQRWRWLDLAVASSVLVVIGGVLSTQILSSRTQSLRLGCQNNMQLTYAGLANYASMNGNRLPIAQERGRMAFAGMYGPTLRKAGHLKSDRTLICPESELARDLEVHLPTLDELEQAPAEELPQLQRRAGGTYAFKIGYLENGKYQVVKLQHRLNAPLMSDPVAHDKGPGNNHGQRGQNVLFEDGCVRFLTECQHEGCRDHYYINDAGEEAAGLHAEDTVLLRSGNAPVR
jgi:hypothetical protein